MRAGRGRLPKNFVLEDRLERFSAGFETHPARLRGQWKTACFPSVGKKRPNQNSAQNRVSAFSELHVDLGCGKGTFTIEAAHLRPEVLFVGVDSEPVCIAYAAQHAVEAALPNVMFFSGNALRLSDYFAPEEINCIYLNFPTPFPKRRDAHLRLPRAERLQEFRFLLAEDGKLCFKTDSQPLYDFFLTQIPLANWELMPKDEAQRRMENLPKSEYEKRLTHMGAPVLSLICTPTDPAPEHIVQTAELSLAEYLPRTEAELRALTYAPLGMSATVRNLANRELNREQGRHRSRELR